MRRRVEYVINKGGYHVLNFYSCANVISVLTHICCKPLMRFHCPFNLPELDEMLTQKQKIILDAETSTHKFQPTSAY